MKKIVILLLLTSITSLMAKEIQVLSAVKKNKSISNAKVIFQKTGETSVVSQTNNNGNAIYNGFSGIDSADTMMLIKKKGYSTLIAKCPCDGLSYALSPQMKNLDGMRIVLNWSKSPKDLDSHLAYKNSHVFYEKKTGEQARLDVDDTDGYGPETITIEKKLRGEKYLYAVHDFTHNADAKSSDMSLSGAVVRVYIGKTLMRTYTVPKNKAGNTWLVFGIEKNGAFTDINTFIGSNALVSVAKNMKSILNESSFKSNTIISRGKINQAKALNKKGEKVYHQKNLEAAMILFQEAINLYPQFGQAYSNLGLTFQKLGRNAEALWANRKAIERASGKKAHIVKASSYYNIAKVYESQAKWLAAKKNYEFALSNRTHNAYKKGIKRMNEKLQGHPTLKNEW